MVLLEVELSTRFENANDLPDVHSKRENMISVSLTV